MPTNKEKLLKGLNLLMLCFPFATLGPALFFWKGAQSIKNGEPWWFVICVLMMLAGMYFFIRGLRMILDAFFD